MVLMLRCRPPDGEVFVTARCGFRNGSFDEKLADFLTAPAGNDDDQFRLPGSNTPVSPATGPASSGTQDAIRSGGADSRRSRSRDRRGLWTGRRGSTGYGR